MPYAFGGMDGWQFKCTKKMKDDDSDGRLFDIQVSSALLFVLERDG